MPKHRLFVDEVGNADLASAANDNEQYLSLTGVIVPLNAVSATLEPRLTQLKAQYFGAPAAGARPIVLHRKELVNKRTPFEALRDAAVEAAFNGDLLALLADCPYRVITVVIDKREHRERYGVWHFDPYHYCLTNLVERYVLELRSLTCRGDVMAEARGRREDTRLKKSFRRIYEHGTDNIPPGVVTAHLTSVELRLVSKWENVAGLQVADALAHPSFRATLARRNGQDLPGNFGGQIAAILEATKYRRHPTTGRIDGWGRKWLP